MTREIRTRKQIDANSLDLEVFRVVRQIERFASDHREPDSRELAATIEAMRHRIRRHMHPKDREATA